LSSRDVVVQIIAERSKWSWAAMESRHGVCIRRLPRFFDNYLGALVFKVSLTLYLLCYGRRYSVWHLNQIGFNACLAIVLGKMLRRPVVLKLTGAGVTGIDRKVRAVPLSFLCRSLSKWADAYICPSRETMNDALEFGLDPSKLFLIPNGIDVEEFHPVGTEQRESLKKELGFEGKSIVLFLGRLSTEKNPIGLVEAWRQIDPSCRHDWTLVMVGGGGARSAVEKLIQQYHLEDSVHLAGASNQVLAWLNAADIFVLPSLGEGLSNALLEAMSCGLPVVATNVSGVQQLVGASNCGLIARNCESESIRGCLEQLMNESKATLRAIGVRGREFVAREYAMPHVTARYLELYARWSLVC